MNDLLSHALELQQVAHELMYLGTDGEPIYSDHFCRLNKEVLVKADALFSSKSSNMEEEANLCLALLMGYNATIYDNGDKEQKKQFILDRINNLLEKLPVSLLKLRLLTACYSEVFNEPLTDEGHVIIASWDSTSLTAEQQEAIAEFQNVIDNPYPWEYVDE